MPERLYKQSYLNDPFLPSAVGGTSFSSDKIIKRFISVNSAASTSIGGVTDLDDPTYLGFSLRFDILSPLFNGSIVNNTKKPEPPEPDLLIFNPTDNTNLGLGLNLANQPSNNGNPKVMPPSYAQSALGYLDAVGENVRANYLKSFIQGLLEVNSNRSYYWQTIEGLEEAWGKILAFTDPYVGSASETELIKVNCLEAIDLKITSLFNLYKYAIYDFEYKRRVLPRNLLFFDVYVDVYEIRRFKYSKNWINKHNPNISGDEVSQFLNENTSKVTFKFSDCVWDPIQSGSFLKNVSNVSPELASTTIGWKYSNISIISNFSGYDSVISEVAAKQTGNNVSNAVNNDKRKNKALNAIKDRVKNEYETLKSEAKSLEDKAEIGFNILKNTAAQRAEAAVQNALLGNVYGLPNTVLSALQNPAILVDAVTQGIDQLLLLSNKVPPTRNLGENVLGQPPTIQNSIQSESIYPDLTGPSELNSVNIFGPGPSGPPPLEPYNVYDR